MVIKINVTNKRAVLVGSPVIVCGNSGYTLEFTFDAEWSAESVRTARFVYVRDGSVQYQDVVFSGTTARVPVLANIKEVRVGVFAGDLHTSTPALIPCEKSIRCGTGAPEDPTPSQYDQIMELLTAGAGGGVSPVVSVEDIEGGHRVTVTDVLGKKSFDVLNGQPGEPGPAGQPGRDASNPNLLDNWYFADPVNQRGQTEYTGAGYTIDRWKHDGTLAINDGYITHTPNEWWNALYQPIDAKIANALIGRKVTLSVLARSAVSGNQMRIALYDITANNMEETAAYINTDGDLEVLAATFTVPESFAGHVISAHFSVSTNFAGQGGCADLVAVKLEIGDKQTLAHQDASGKWALNDPPPDKGMELLKCQRYYQLFSSAEKRPSDKRDFRPELRTNATAANTGTIEIEGVTYYYADANL